MDDDGKTSITLDSILNRLPPEAQAWIKNMDATDYEITEKLILRNVGVETFVGDVRRGCSVSFPAPGANNGVNKSTSPTNQFKDSAIRVCAWPSVRDRQPRN